MIEDPQSTEGDPEPQTGRRDMLKKGVVAAGVAGAAWVAPKVDGLSLRPDYASAQSAGTPNPLTSNAGLGPGLGAPNTVNQSFLVLPAGTVNITQDWDPNNGTLTLTRDAGTCAFTSLNAAGSDDGGTLQSVNAVNANAIVATVNIGADPDVTFVAWDMSCT